MSEKFERLTKPGISASGVYKTCCADFRGRECEMLEGQCERCSTNNKVWDQLAAYENSGLSPARVMELAEAERDGGWVSVDDRLPDGSAPLCLIWCNPGYLLAPYLAGGWASDYLDSSDEATHWMPLPEPPAAKGQPCE